MPEIISREEAIARGLTKYFTGEPCRNGHVSERYAKNGGRCVQCALNKNKLPEAMIRTRANRKKLRQNPEWREKQNAKKRRKWASLPPEKREARRLSTLNHQRINAEQVRERSRRYRLRRNAAYEALKQLGIEI